MDDENEGWQSEDTANQSWDTGQNWEAQQSRDQEDPYHIQLQEAKTVPDMMRVARERLELLLENDPDEVLDSDDLDKLLQFILHVSDYNSQEDVRNILGGVVSWSMTDLEGYAREVRRHVAFTEGNTALEAFERAVSEAEENREW